jgi:AP endonuclease-2
VPLSALILSLSETKITRAQMDQSLACMKTYDSFFSFYRRTVKGIHGTAIFTKRATCIPLKAEEGIGSSLVPAAVTMTERIGGYPISSDVDLSFSEMKDLDAEGRTTVCDFGMFVLINL